MERKPVHVLIEVVVTEKLTTGYLYIVNIVRHSTRLQNCRSVPLVVVRPPHIDAGARWVTVNVHCWCFVSGASLPKLGTCMGGRKFGNVCVQAYGRPISFFFGSEIAAS